MNDEYAKLTSMVRRIVIDEIKNGKYVHLKNPNNKNNANAMIRPNYLFRPGKELGKGKRNLSVGSNELILEYHGTIEDIKKGFHIQEHRGLRIIAGDLVRDDAMHQLARLQNNPLVHTYLCNGEYANFVRATLQETDYTLNEFPILSKKGYFYF